MALTLTSSCCSNSAPIALHSLNFRHCFQLTHAVAFKFTNSRDKSLNTAGLNFCLPEMGIEASTAISSGSSDKDRDIDSFLLGLRTRCSACCEHHLHRRAVCSSLFDDEKTRLAQLKVALPSSAAGRLVMRGDVGRILSTRDVASKKGKAAKKKDISEQSAALTDDDETSAEPEADGSATAPTETAVSGVYEAKVAEELINTIGELSRTTLEPRAMAFSRHLRARLALVFATHDAIRRECVREQLQSAEQTRALKQRLEAVSTDLWFMLNRCFCRLHRPCLRALALVCARWCHFYCTR